MTSELQKVFNRVAQLPESQQDSVAFWLAQELDDERRWDEAFQESPSLLERLAEEARQEYQRGETQPLNLDSF